MRSPATGDIVSPCISIARSGGSVEGLGVQFGASRRLVSSLMEVFPCHHLEHVCGRWTWDCRKSPEPGFQRIIPKRVGGLAFSIP